MTNNTIATGTEKAATVYVPFGGNRVDLGTEAQLPVPENPLLQYATGLPATRPMRDKEGYQVYDEDTGEEVLDSFNYTGFFTAVGADPELDAVMTSLEVPTITIHHNSGPVKHWQLNKVTGFLLARGIPSNAGSEGKYGIVYQWRTNPKNGKRESVLYVQIMVKPLLPHYTKPFVFTVRSTQTSDALTAFSRQYKVLARAHEELQRYGVDMPLPLYSYSLTLKASNKQDIRGQGPVEQRKAIYPLLSLIPDAISNDYLQRQEMPLEYRDLLRDGTGNAIEWAKALSQRISNGGDGHEEGSLSTIDNAPF